jgi:hypothetical protein
MNLKLGKENWYRNRQVDLDALSREVENWLARKGYFTQLQRAEDKSMWLIQAQKKGIFRTVVAANRAFSIIFEGEPNEFYFKTGISEWVTNVPAVGTALLISLGTLSIPICISFAWALKLQNDIKKYIRERIDFGKKQKDLQSDSDDSQSTESIILGPEKLKETKLKCEFEKKCSVLKKAYEAGALDQQEFNNKINKLRSHFEVEKQLIYVDSARENNVLSESEHKAKVQDLMKKIGVAS